MQRSVYRQYLDKFRFRREKDLDSIIVSHKKSEIEYNDRNKKILVKIYKNHQLKYESTYKYDDDGMNIGQIYIRYDSLGHIEVKKSYSHKYDKHGNLSELECYDIEGKLIRKITPEFDENGNLDKTKKKFINKDGSLNRITINEYDIKGNNILRKECFSGSCKSAIEYKYDESGKLIEETRYRDSEIVTKINHEEEKDEGKEKPIYKYDSQGNWVEKFYIEPLNDRQFFIYTKIKRNIVYYQ